MEPAKVADAIASAVAKGADMQLVNDGVLEPKGISRRGDSAQSCCLKFASENSCSGGAFWPSLKGSRKEGERNDSFPDQK